MTWISNAPARSDESFQERCADSKKAWETDEQARKIMTKLIMAEPLENKHCDHVLIGAYAGRRKCHIEPDWLLI